MDWAEVKYITAEDEITVYWERADWMIPGEPFRIFLDGAEAAVTEKTHCTLTGLRPERLYHVRVAGGSWQSEVLAISTGKRKKRIDITAAPYLAVGNGTELNTERIQRAIDDCGEEEAVYVPEGVFLTGALRLHSNMELYLEKGAVLQGTAEVKDYLPKIGSRFEGTEMACYSSVLNMGYLEEASGGVESCGSLKETSREAEFGNREVLSGTPWRAEDSENLGKATSQRNPANPAQQGFVCENVVIRGQGTIASGGRLLAERVIAGEREEMERRQEEMERRQEEMERKSEEMGRKPTKLAALAAECECAETLPGRVRPRLVNISRCRHILLSGVTFRNGASWNVHMIYSRDIITRGCTFVSEEVWNGDGWDPDSSEDCTIFDCDFFTGDDCIAVKSGKNPEGNRIGRPCRHIRIFDCRSAFGHGITIGSEMSGGVEDVAVWDCDLRQSVYGLEIKGTWKRGGYVKNIRVDNCQIPRLMFHAVDYNNDGEPAAHPPVFSGCRFKHMQILGEYYNRKREWTECDAIELCGFEQEGYEVSDIRFEDVVLGREGSTGKKTLSLNRCRGLEFRNLKVL